PPRLNRYEPTQIAIQLSMIVVITSLVPANAFSAPAIAAHAAPAAHAPASAKTMWTKPAIPLTEVPIQTATNEPTRYWPWPPMLNRAQRHANATASPTRL